MLLFKALKISFYLYKGGYFMKTLFAHRGMSSLAPENTLAAFKKCREFGLHWAECDVDALADGTVVVSHDDTLDRCTNRSGSLYDLTVDDLQDIDAGSWFSGAFTNEPMPKLGQLIALVNQEKLHLNIEIKACRIGWKQTLVLIDGVIRELEKLDTPRELIISSFNHLALYEFKQRRPQTRIACLFDRYTFKKTDWLSVMQACQAESIHIEDEGLTEEIIKEIKQQGYVVRVYTVNNIIRANQLFNWGVEGLFTDIGQQFPLKYLKY